MTHSCPTRTDSHQMNGIGINFGLIPKNPVIWRQEKGLEMLSASLLPFRGSWSFVPKNDLVFSIPSIDTDTIGKITLLVSITDLVFPPLIVDLSQVYRRQFVYNAAATGNGA